MLGRDNDLGYGILRVDEDQRWSLFYLFQPIWHVGNALLFEYSIAAYDLELGGYLAKKNRMSEEDKATFRANAKEVGAKIKRQATKDYLVHPALSLATGSARTTLTANVVANLVRNMWTNTVIICGHFPPASRPSRRPRSRARPAASGTCARCSARATSAARRPCT